MLDWDKVTDASTNFLVEAINRQTTLAPPTSTPAPLPGSGVAATGSMQDQGTLPPSEGGIPWMYIGIGAVVLIGLAIYIRR